MRFVCWRCPIVVRLSPKVNNRLTQGIAFMLVSCVLLSCVGREGCEALIGRVAPDFRYQDISGAQGTLQGLRGKVVLLRFWADWCPYCRFEMPKIDQSYKRLRSKGYEVLAVNVGQSLEVVEAFTAEMNLHYPMILDPAGKLAQSYGVKVIPTNILIDREGVIREILIGEVFQEERGLSDLLKRYFSGEA